MNKFLNFIFVCFSVFGSCLAQDSASSSPPALNLKEQQTVFTREILPEDVVQESIKLVKLSANKFAVRWTYTIEGAEKFLTFREAHDGQMVRVKIGEFETSGSIYRFHPTQLSATFDEWKVGWLKHRGDKFFSVSEEVANQIFTALRNE